MNRYNKYDYVGDKPAYWCDHEKHNWCSKDSCEHLGKGNCIGTIYSEFAQTDETGHPKIRYHNGNECYEEMKNKYPHII